MREVGHFVGKRGRVKVGLKCERGRGFCWEKREWFKIGWRCEIDKGSCRKEEIRDG